MPQVQSILFGAVFGEGGILSRGERWRGSLTPPRARIHWFCVFRAALLPSEKQSLWRHEERPFFFRAVLKQAGAGLTEFALVLQAPFPALGVMGPAPPVVKRLWLLSGFSACLCPTGVGLPKHRPPCSSVCARRAVPCVTFNAFRVSLESSITATCGLMIVFVFNPFRMKGSLWVLGYLWEWTLAWITDSKCNKLFPVKDFPIPALERAALSQLWEMASDVHRSWLCHSWFWVVIVHTGIGIMAHSSPWQPWFLADVPVLQHIS